MALRVAVANGNWSNPATWNNGVFPVAGDVVASNGFTVTIDQDINVDSLTNTVGSGLSIIKLMTDYSSAQGTVSASSEYNGSSYQAWKAFDGSTSSSFNAWLTTNGAFSSYAPQWLQYEFNTPTVIRAYKIILSSFGASSSPTNWEFQAWDGTNWITLEAVTGGSVPYTGSFTNETAYSRYRLFITNIVNPASWCSIGELQMFENSFDDVTSVAGGGFILDGTYTITTTGQGLVTGSTRLLTYTGSNSLINGNIVGSTTTNVQTVYHDSTGALTINGDVINTANTSVDVIVTNSTGNLNINGFINKTGRGNNIVVASVCTINIVGNLITNTNFSGGSCVDIRAGATVNITGNLSHISAANLPKVLIVNSNACIVNITGDVFHNSPITSNEVIIFNQPGRVSITGSVYNLQPSSVTVRSSTNGYLSIVGSIYTTVNQVAVVSTNSGAVNLFSGPFICSEYGFMPYLVTRMHLIPSASSYIEFRDETTGGASAPVPAAPATQLISPSTLVSNLAESDVRFGIVYAMGTLTGTLRMPTPNQVTFGVAVDDTFGNSVLTAASVWDYLVSNITVEDSIGMRLKNVSTPQTTGEQLEAFLRLD